MSSKKQGVIWKAPPHTIAKIEILRTYLTAWFAILGRTKKKQDLLYIDGFAGPGEYLNHPTGSPIAALETATNALSTLGKQWIAGTIHLGFIDHDSQILGNLRQKIATCSVPQGIQIHLYNTFFTDALSQLKKALPAPFVRSSPLFVFIDPFGATGVPFSAVSDLLRSGCSEVLINLDADGIARIFAAGHRADSQTILNDIFGTPDWQEKTWKSLSFDQQCREVLEFYKSRLRQLPNVKYVFAFEMRTTKTAINYHLVFASQHPLGLEKMKEAMKKMDQDGTYSFSDAGVLQPGLFRFDDPYTFSERLSKAFRGMAVSYADVNDYALNETPFVNPKSMLKVLENKGLITVESSDPKRRKGTFNENKTKCILFSS